MEQSIIAFKAIALLFLETLIKAYSASTIRASR